MILRESDREEMKDNNDDGSATRNSRKHHYRMVDLLTAWRPDGLPTTSGASEYMYLYTVRICLYFPCLAEPKIIDESSYCL